jgi:hypothetical protein
MIFVNYIKFENSVLPKHHFTFVTCSVILQINKKSCHLAFLSRVQIELNNLLFFTLRRYCRKSLTVRHILNSLTFKIFWDGLYMSCISKNKTSRPPWVTPRPMLCSEQWCIHSTEFKLPMCCWNLMLFTSFIPFEARPLWCWSISLFLDEEDILRASFFVLGPNWNSILENYYKSNKSVIG